MKISVCLATYNGEEFLKLQIESILRQLSTFDELLISDDGSTDNTVSIINNFNDDRIKLFINSNKRGVAHNFENALLNATGDYILLSDQDDIWKDNKVEIIKKELEFADCILHNAELINSDGEFLDNNLFSIYRTRTGYFENLMRNTFVGCCMAFKKSLLKKILPIPRSITMHDMWIALISEKYSKTRLVNQSLIYYRRHNNNASTTSKKSQYSRIYQLKYRLVMLYYTLLR